MGTASSLAATTGGLKRRVTETACRIFRSRQAAVIVITFPLRGAFGLRISLQARTLLPFVLSPDSTIPCAAKISAVMPSRPARRCSFGQKAALARGLSIVSTAANRERGAQHQHRSPAGSPRRCTVRRSPKIAGAARGSTRRTQPCRACLHRTDRGRSVLVCRLRSVRVSVTSLRGPESAARLA